jgi:UDP-galactopyranose mutase
MNFKNSKNLLLLCVIVLIIAVSLIYSTHYKSSNNGDSIININQVNNITIINSINIQNNVLSNYFNSLYESQISSIDTKYSEGLISREERDKQLNAVIKNSELTNETLTKLANAKKVVFTGNVSTQDILIHNNSFSDIKSDIKDEINDTLYGY